MPNWKVYCFLHGERRKNIIVEWLKNEAVPPDQIAVFQEKIDALERSGPDMVPGFIWGPVAKDIYKMKIKGNKGWKQLRPMCCRGPFELNAYTVLVGAIEKDGRLDPRDAVARAQSNLQKLKNDPTRRICERLTTKPEK